MHYTHIYMYVCVCICSDKASRLVYFMGPGWSSAYMNFCVVKEACIFLNSKLA